MLRYMSYEIDDFLNPEYGLIPNQEKCRLVVEAMNKYEE